MKTKFVNLVLGLTLLLSAVFVNYQISKANESLLFMEDDNIAFADTVNCARRNQWICVSGGTAYDMYYCP